jgi:large subunit ribosomal protein L18
MATVPRRFAKRAARRQRVRRKVRGSDLRPRLSVYRSLKHIYAQVISDQSGRTLAAVSTRDGSVKDQLRNTRDLAAAKAVGKAIAERCKEKGIGTVVFDRNGFLYHGRVKALAEAAREAGLRF